MINPAQDHNEPIYIFIIQFSNMHLNIIFQSSRHKQFLSTKFCNQISVYISYDYAQVVAISS